MLIALPLRNILGSKFPELIDESARDLYDREPVEGEPLQTSPFHIKRVNEVKSGVGGSNAISEANKEAILLLWVHADLNTQHLNPRLVADQCLLNMMFGKREGCLTEGLKYKLVEVASKPGRITRSPLAVCRISRMDCRT